MTAMKIADSQLMAKVVGKVLPEGDLEIGGIVRLRFPRGITGKK
jgi:hypothetical protein